MKLKIWLDKSGVKPTDFAEKIGVTHPTIYRYLSGKQVPKRKTMARISEVTNGEVSANDFFDLEKAS